MADLNYGYLHVTIGPMFSTKTTNLIKHLTHYADMAKINGLPAPLLINSNKDTRDKERVVSSHSSGYKGISEFIVIKSTGKLKDVDVSNYHVIGIDEHQFYDDYAETVLKWKQLGKRIYSAGLVGDANQNDFGQVCKILPKIDKIEFLTAVCHFCLQNHKNTGKILTPEDLETMKAPFTKRIIGIESANQIDIGASDKYLPACGKHL